MKIFVVLAVLVAGLPAGANSWDSVAVFYRAEKTVVLINEKGPRGWPQSRLQAWMDLFVDRDDLEILSPAEDLKISCGRNLEASTCTFRFHPSENNSFQNKKVEARVPIAELVTHGFQPPPPNGTNGNFDISFLNSNGDKFRMWIEGDELRLKAEKR